MRTGWCNSVLWGEAEKEAWGQIITLYTHPRSLPVACLQTATAGLDLCFRRNAHIAVSGWIQGGQRGGRETNEASLVVRQERKGANQDRGRR